MCTRRGLPRRERAGAALVRAGHGSRDISRRHRHRRTISDTGWKYVEAKNPPADILVGAVGVICGALAVASGRRGHVVARIMIVARHRRLADFRRWRYEIVSGDMKEKRLYYQLAPGTKVWDHFNQLGALRGLSKGVSALRPSVELVDAVAPMERVRPFAKNSLFRSRRNGAYRGDTGVFE